MEKRVLGKTGMNVSVLGFGAAEIGYEGADQPDIDKLVNSALDQGLNAIDTAECYVDSEEKLGRAAAKRRKEFFLFTKVGHAGNFFTPAWSAAEISASIDRSLKNLQTDYVDLVQLHSCDSDVLKKGEAIEALQKAKQAGKTRFIGYSGDGQDALTAIDMDVFDTLQTSVSIFDQQCIDVLLPRAKEKNIGVIAKRPIGNAVWRFKTKPGNEYVQEYWRRAHELAYDFVDGDEAGVSEKALRFTLSQPGVCTMIVGTTRPGRWQENAKLIAAGPLPDSEIKAIRARWAQVASADWVGQV
ncbi:MAG: aldo/keto reductase [Cyanobacteria bacterium SZAS LIN-2]|nr:aldo/keto reductase [Cyanobacteria bacterium SZAS LIN-2]